MIKKIKELFALVEKVKVLEAKLEASEKLHSEHLAKLAHIFSWIGK